MRFALEHEIGKHLRERLDVGYIPARIRRSTNLDRVQRSPSALWMKLDTPNLLTGLRRGLDAFDRRIIAVDEERFPTFRERFLQLQGILVILAVGGSLSKPPLWSRVELGKPCHIDPPSLDGAGRS